MKTAIVVFSKTGITKSLAERAADALRAKGHDVDLFLLKTDPPMEGDKAPQKFEIVNAPDLTAYEAVLVGGPVWAFSPNPVTKRYMESVMLSGKKFMPFTTMGFPLRCLGGNRTLRVMSRLARKAGADVIKGIAVPKMLRDHEKLMAEAVDFIADNL